MSYLKDVNLKETSEALVSLRTFATQHNVPIITEEGIRFLNQIIKLRNAKNVLEIGSAIGYSALAMIKANSALHVTTIERDPAMQKKAQETFAQYDQNQQITLILGDALFVDLSLLKETYDVVFIDGAKAQSQKFFERFQPLLSKNGVIVTDNLMFKGLVEKKETVESKNLKQLLKKIDAFNRYVVNKEGFDTTIYPIGDGMSVSIKKD